MTFQVTVFSVISPGYGSCESLYQRIVSSFVTTCGYPTPSKEIRTVYWNCQWILQLCWAQTVKLLQQAQESYRCAQELSGSFLGALGAWGRWEHLRLSQYQRSQYGGPYFWQFPGWGRIKMHKVLFVTTSRICTSRYPTGMGIDSSWDSVLRAEYPHFWSCLWVYLWTFFW